MEPHRTVRPSEPATEGTAARAAASGGWWAGALAGAVLLAAGACAESTIGGSIVEKSARMTISHDVDRAQTSSALRSRGVSADVTIDDDPQFVVDSVDVVIRELQVGREGQECGFAPVGTTGDGGDGNDCEEVFRQTAAPSLPLDEGFATIADSMLIEPGRWNRFEFQFHVLEVGGPEATPILDDRPELRGASVRITGTFDGQAFELLLTPDDDVTVEADAPVVLDDEELGGMVLVWNLSRWFDDGQGGFIDPVAAQEDQGLRDQIETNLVEALEIVASSG